jgi:hypothetical protein
MPTPFAYPIADNAPSVVAGRAFRQAILPSSGGGGGGDKIPGMEVFLPASDHRLFACLTGRLFWEPASGPNPNRLILRPSPETIGFLRRVAVFECHPVELIYENVDKAAVQAAIDVLLRAAFLGTSSPDPRNWHPSMRQIAGTGPKARDRLDKIVGVDPDKYAAEVAQKFVASSARNFFIDVAAGDEIGAADLFPGDVPSGHPRQFILYTIDAGEQFISPLFYLHEYANTPQCTVPGTLSSNPLIPAFSLGTDQPARLQLPAPNGGVEFPFPIAPHLQTPHGNPRSPFNWFYTDAGKISIEGQGEPVPDSVANLPDFSEVDRVWTNHGAEIARQCALFQIPCEVVTAIFATESGGNGRAYRLEVMREEWLKQAKGNSALPGLLFKYAQVLGTVVLEYTPTRLLSGPQFGESPITELNVKLLSAHAMSRNQLTNPRSRHVFIDDGIFQPDVVEHSTSEASTTDHRIRIAEERILRTIQQSAPTTDTFYHPAPFKVPAGTTPPGIDTPVATSNAITYTSDRSGRAHVMRAKLVSPVNFDLVLTLFVRNTAGANPVQLRIPKQSAGGSTTLADVDIAKNDPVAIRVERDPPTAPGAFELEVEWFLGVDGADAAPFSPPAMFMVLDGRGSGGGLTQLGPQWNDNLDVRPGRSMTFGDLAHLVEITGGGFMSPGLAQTTIETAFSTVKKMQDRGIGALVGVPPVTNARDMLRAPNGTDLGWLFTPKNAIFAGLSKMREEYATLGTWFDLPRLAGAYYGGMRPKSARWGFDLPLQGRYGDIIARRLNAIVQRFDGTAQLASPPTVRFRK